MEYKEIVSVTGLPGLYQLLSTKSDGAIVRTLDGETTRFAPSRTHNFTPLESIEVFTNTDNVPLSDVFKAMQEKEKDHPVAEPKDSETIKAYFEEVFPGLDKDRVYMSDMKKMLKWYPLLKENDLLKFEEEIAENETETGGTETHEEKESDEKESEEEETTEKKRTTKKKDDTGKEEEKKSSTKTKPKAKKG